MKTEERWYKTGYPVELEFLPPRIRRDILSIPAPGNLPAPISSMFLHGEPEVGKTLYAAWLYLEECKRLYLAGKRGESTMLFVSTPDLFLELRRSFDDSNISEFEVLEKYRQAAFLVLDDFGTVKPTDWVMQTLYTVINYRYEYLKTTIFTSNICLDEIATLFGDTRITSRIERMGQVKKVTSWKRRK